MTVFYRGHCFGEELTDTIIIVDDFGYALKLHVDSYLTYLQQQ